MLEQAGLPDEALEAYRRATALARDDDVEWARLVLRRARVRERSGSFVTALRELRVAERRLEGVDERRGDPCASGRRDDAGHRARGPGAAPASAGGGGASRGGGRGDRRAPGPRQRLQRHRLGPRRSWATSTRRSTRPRIVEIYHSLGEPHRAAGALGNQGAVFYWLGRWDEALDCYWRAHEAYALSGDVVNAAVHQANAAELLINRGDLVRGREAILEAQQTHRAVGFNDGALFDEVQVGRLLLAEGEVDAAAAVLQAALDEATTMGLQGTVLDAAVHLAACHVAAGRGQDALEVLASAEQGPAPRQPSSRPRSRWCARRP